MKQEKICPICHRPFTSNRENKICFGRSCQRLAYPALSYQIPAMPTSATCAIPRNPRETKRYTMYNRYGKSWPVQSRLCRQRDNYTCQHCGVTPGRSGIHVHHIIPIRKFNGDHESGNRLDNLIVLCKQCHKQVHCELRKKSY